MNDAIDLIAYVDKIRDLDLIPEGETLASIDASNGLSVERNWPTDATCTCRILLGIMDVYVTTWRIERGDDGGLALIEKRYQLLTGTPGGYDLLHIESEYTHHIESEYTPLTLQIPHLSPVDQGCAEHGVCCPGRS